MDMVFMEVSAVLLLAAMILLLRRRRALVEKVNPTSLGRLDEVERSAEQMKLNCLSALHDVKHRLEALEERAIAAERSDVTLGVAPAAERKEPYHAAALLLYAGHPAQRVAEVLDLPLAQIEMVQQLQKMIGAESRMKPAHDALARSDGIGKNAKRKSAARHGKSRPRPILLTDMVAAEEVGSDVVEPSTAPNGSAA
ncbi:MAG TPA: hypothetical protein VMT22_19295 [Terriglobales bacterium]|jgi:hypothetical protein|nr:hypothetical protein [Terriglobales bacterium]